MTDKGRRYVIISPVRDEEQYLSKTIESMINQTIHATEYLLVDDGSADNTPNIIQHGME